MSLIERIAITGSSGYCGRSFISQIRKLAPEVRILGLDVAAPRTDHPDEFQQVDTRDPAIADRLREFAPDTVVHMAFIVNATRSDAFMRDVNVNGSRNVFQAISGLKPARFLYYSSMTAYGAWPDNPTPMHEDWQLRARSDFRYGADKTELEGDILKFSQEHPEIAVSWVRPTIILGEGVSNYLSNYILNSYVILLPDGKDVATQFVHENDLARATWTILAGKGRGAYNICPEDWINWSEVAKLRRCPALPCPAWLARGIMRTYRSLYLPPWFIPGLDGPSGLINFIRHPWVGAPRRLADELGFQFEYSSRQTIELAVRKAQSQRTMDPRRKPREERTELRA